MEGKIGGRTGWEQGTVCSFFIFPKGEKGGNGSGVCCIPFRLNSNLLLAFYIFPSADGVCRLKVPYLLSAPARAPRANPEGRYRLHGVLIMLKSHSLRALHCVLISLEALGLALLSVPSSGICSSRGSVSLSLHATPTSLIHHSLPGLLFQHRAPMQITPLQPLLIRMFVDLPRVLTLGKSGGHSKRDTRCFHCSPCKLLTQLSPPTPGPPREQQRAPQIPAKAHK